MVDREVVGPEVVGRDVLGPEVVDSAPVVVEDSAAVSSEEVDELVPSSAASLVAEVGEPEVVDESVTADEPSVASVERESRDKPSTRSGAILSGPPGSALCSGPPAMTLSIPPVPSSDCSGSSVPKVTTIAAVSTVRATTTTVSVKKMVRRPGARRRPRPWVDAVSSTDGRRNGVAESASTVDVFGALGSVEFTVPLDRRRHTGIGSDNPLGVPEPRLAGGPLKFAGVAGGGANGVHGTGIDTNSQQI